ncbi:MAG: hypothetical protein ACOCQ4_01760 [bacterium]
MIGLDIASFFTKPIGVGVIISGNIILILLGVWRTYKNYYLFGHFVLASSLIVISCIAALKLLFL